MPSPFPDLISINSLKQCNVTVREHEPDHAGLVPGDTADAEEELAAVIGVGVLGEGTI